MHHHNFYHFPINIKGKRKGQIKDMHIEKAVSQINVNNKYFINLHVFMSHF